VVLCCEPGTSPCLQRDAMGQDCRLSAFAVHRDVLRVHALDVGDGVTPRPAVDEVPGLIETQRDAVIAHSTADIVAGCSGD